MNVALKQPLEGETFEFGWSWRLSSSGFQNQWGIWWVLCLLSIPKLHDELHDELCLSHEVEITWIASGESGKAGPTVSRRGLGRSGTYPILLRWTRRFERVAAEGGTSPKHNLYLHTGEFSRGSDLHQAQYCGLGHRSRAREIAVPRPREGLPGKIFSGWVWPWMGQNP
jgi:hypothetical protein